MVVRRGSGADDDPEPENVVDVRGALVLPEHLRTEGVGDMEGRAGSLRDWCDRPNKTIGAQKAFEVS